MVETMSTDDGFFVNEAVNALKDVCNRFELELSTFNERQVLFLNSTSLLELGWGRFSYEIHVDLGLLELSEKWPLGIAICMVDPEAGSRYRNWCAYKPEALEKGLRHVADLLDTYGAPFFEPAPDLEERANEAVRRCLEAANNPRRRLP